jgi:hypothetical protein
VLTRFAAPALAGARHAFLGRTGGVSTGIYASLNVGLGSGDDPQAVRENRCRALAAVAPGTRLVTLRQVHSATCHAAGHWSEDARPEGDALVTADPDVAIGVLTADCTPILLWDRRAGVVGAAHAGWKGALAGVIEATVDAMLSLGAARADIAAAIGPTIRQESYEVGAEFRARFLAEDPKSHAFFAEGPAGRPHFDLPGYVAHRLRGSGVAQVNDVGADTFADPERFFSYRRAVRAGVPDYGRQLSLISP